MRQGQARSVWEFGDPEPAAPVAVPRIRPTIRPATLAEVPALVAMGQAFRATHYADTLPDAPDAFAALATTLITSEDGLLLVAGSAAELIGMIGMVLFAHHLSGARTAAEVFWWVDPAARGTIGLRLLAQAEAWAIARGAAQLQMVAPSPAVGRLYERRGYRLVELAYVRAVEAPAVTPQATPSLTPFEAVADACRARVATAAPPLRSIPAPRPDLDVAAIHVHDAVLPADYAVWARARRFGSVAIGPAVFDGLAPCDDDTLPAWIRAHYPHAQPTLTFFRQSPAGQVEPNYIHTDRDMGDWTAILYLTAEPRLHDGTRFWRHRDTGATASTATTDAEFKAEWAAWRDLAQWEPWHTVPAAPGRLVVFPAPCFHSRAIFENYGTAGADARLLQLVFGTGSLETVEEGVCQ